MAMAAGVPICGPAYTDSYTSACRDEPFFAAALYDRMLLQVSMETSGTAALRNDHMKWTDDEDDHDSDTDSKLSGSAIVDSVM